ncbi:GNAT family N-acetyltransferase [Oscillospiraceae bacterium PP1C4]
MNITFEQGHSSDIDELEILYNDLNDFLAGGKNYPGWIKGIYPVRETAVDGISEKCLYVARHNGRIVGSVILRHKPEPIYHKAKWQIDAEYKDVFVIYTLVVHPAYFGQGIGMALMKFILTYSEERMAKAVRLDVYAGNMPAINLYKKCGFQYIDTVDLGLEHYGLKWFELYEKVI